MARRPRGRARAGLSPSGLARRPHRPDATREGDPLRRGVDALGMARTRRWARRLADAPHRARRGSSRHASLADPGLFSLVEVLAPTLIDYAPPELAADVVPRLLSGVELWCQGFSEPGTGSDLSSLRCRAVPDGDARDRDELGDQRAEGLDEPRAVLATLRAPHPHRSRRVAPSRHHRVLRRHGHARGSRSPRSR